MISYSEATKLIEDEFKSIELQTEIVSLDEASNRTLAEDVIADINLPPFDNSAVDGIAIKYNDAITEWKIIGEISAGNYKEFSFEQNSAVSIMTGSKIPAYCDTVIPIEDIVPTTAGVKIKKGSRYLKGVNIRNFGSDIKKEEIAVEDGTLLKARHLASAATCGKTFLKVLKPIQFSVLSTGDELIPVGEKPSGDKIRSSNNYALLGAITELNQTAINFGFVNDDREVTKNTIFKMLTNELDILITTGGVSVGKYDFVKDIFKELGVEEIFWRANIKPGKPAYFGKLIQNGRTKLIFGLPGNPVSSIVNFEIYIKPFIMKIFGMGDIEKLTAILENDVRKTDKKRHFLKAYFYEDNESNYKVISQRSQSSGNLVELSRANCLIEIEEEKLNPVAGDKVRCIKI